ncbi:MAG: PQQ-binding-like beta-propeller repeat protein, partial [Deltaproteobacteria bacterium]
MSAYRTAALPVMVVAVNGAVHGVDSTSGAALWTNPLDGAGFGVVEIEIENDALLACPAGGFVFCLDQASGETRWRAATSGLHGRATMLMDGDRVVVAKGGAVDCFAVATGEKLWSVKNVGTGSVALGVPGRVRQADLGG